MRVKNITSPSGNPVPNQFIITDDEGNEFFQSYTSIIVRRDPSGGVTLDPGKWDFSVTTGKYRNAFLGESKKDTLAKIASGLYKLENLN